MRTIRPSLYFPKLGFSGRSKSSKADGESKNQTISKLQLRWTQNLNYFLALVLFGMLNTSAFI